MLAKGSSGDASSYSCIQYIFPAIYVAYVVWACGANTHIHLCICTRMDTVIYRPLHMYVCMFVCVLYMHQTIIIRSASVSLQAPFHDVARYS